METPHLPLALSSFLGLITRKILPWLVVVYAFYTTQPTAGADVVYEFYNHGNLAVDTLETPCGASGYRYAVPGLDESGILAYKLSRMACGGGTRSEVVVSEIHSKTTWVSNLYLTKASNGVTYGVLRPGAAGAEGYIFTYRADGSTNILWSCGSDRPYNGFGPNSALLEHPNGYLYGTTYFAGPGSGFSGGGVLYRIRLDGTRYSVVAAFHESGTAGITPFGKLLLGSDGYIYGTAGGGPRQAQGIIFRVHPDRPNSSFYVGESWVAKSFRGEFSSPQLSFEGSDGALYGNLLLVVDNPFRSLGYAPFRISKTGQDFQVLSQSLPQVAMGYKALAEGADGSIYGVGLDPMGFPSGGVFEWRPKKGQLRFSREPGSVTFAWSIGEATEPVVQLEAAILPTPYPPEWFRTSDHRLSNSTRVVTFPSSTLTNLGMLLRLQ